MTQSTFQNIKTYIDGALRKCFGPEHGDAYLDEQPPFPESLEEQGKWVDSQCFKLRELIDKERLS
jgi:hypothetical protein